MHYRGRAYLGRIAGIEAMSPSPDSFHNLSPTLPVQFYSIHSPVWTFMGIEKKEEKKQNENSGHARFISVFTFITSLQILLLFSVPSSPFSFLRSEFWEVVG